jgi:hypothetical protein
MYTKRVRKNISTLFVFLTGVAAFVIAQPAHAIQTAASFDVNYAATALNTQTGSAGTANTPRTLTSMSGFEANYNVAIFDYKTVTSLSLMQFENSNIGKVPLTRIALGASYHFIRINGQRILLDNEVEAKQWGISPAIELTIGISKLSINDNGGTVFTASFIDVLPRFLLEIPLSSSFLLLLRAGYLTSVSGGGSIYSIKYSGGVYDIGFRLTTL